ncbi:MAG: hypothetical protein GXO18_07270 [Aquificae bacterium]|nr:hypothetical protein [Aquificota bacterium]
MFYGYIGDARSLNDVITGLLQGRTGVLELFVNRYLLSMRVKEGLITEFRCDAEFLSRKGANSYNLLVYCLAEMLSNPEGFFAFYEDSNIEGERLTEPVSSDELMIQATIVRRELDEVMDKVISPFAIFKASSDDPQASDFEGKNIIEAVAHSKETVVSVVRKIKDFLAEGKLDIYEFREDEDFEESEVDYMMESVPLKRVNIVAILESLRAGRFSGIARISSTTYSINLFYENGEIFAVYPADFDIFEFFLSPDKNADLSLISLDPNIVKFIALRFLSTPEIDTVSSNFMEISKLFIGLSKHKKDALLLVSERGGDRFVVFKEGKLLMSLIETEGKLKPSTSLRFEEPYFVSLFFYRNVRNISSVIYLFIINEVISIFVKHAPSKMINLVLREVVKYPFLTFSENRLHLVKNPGEEEEQQLMNLLAFLLERGAQEIGERKQEEELEFQLRPFKDIFRVLDVDQYLKVRNSGSRG